LIKLNPLFFTGFNFVIDNAFIEYIIFYTLYLPLCRHFFVHLKKNKKKYCEFTLWKTIYVTISFTWLNNLYLSPTRTCYLISHIICVRYVWSVYISECFRCYQRICIWLDLVMEPFIHGSSLFTYSFNLKIVIIVNSLHTN